MSKKNTNTFEAAMLELEKILARLSAEDITLDESMELYAQAAQLVQTCNERLQQAKVKMDEIDKSLQEGQV